VWVVRDFNRLRRRLVPLGVRDPTMTRLVFAGIVRPGVGRQASLLVPGRGALPQAHADWPDCLYPGSLNVRIGRYPLESDGHPGIGQVEQLDAGRFAPAFEILREEFGNNLLHPLPDSPRRGDAQVWRAEIAVESDGRTVSCWALRRFGSAVGQ